MTCPEISVIFSEFCFGFVRSVGKERVVTETVLKVKESCSFCKLCVLWACLELIVWVLNIWKCCQSNVCCLFISVCCPLCSLERLIPETEVTAAVVCGPTEKFGGALVPSYFLSLLIVIGEPSSSVSKVSGYGLDDQAIEVRSLAEAKEFFLCVCVKTGTGAHPVYCDGTKARPGRDADHSPPSTADVENE
jgi:CDGSH-type Zn-finger protein